MPDGERGGSGVRRREGEGSRRHRDGEDRADLNLKLRPGWGREAGRTTSTLTGEGQALHPRCPSDGRSRENTMALPAGLSLPPGPPLSEAGLGETSKPSLRGGPKASSALPCPLCPSAVFLFPSLSAQRGFPSPTLLQGTEDRAGAVWECLILGPGRGAPSGRLTAPFGVP